MVVEVTVKRQAPAAAEMPEEAGCGLLLTRLARAANHSLHGSLAELGLRAQQFGVLHLLAELGPSPQAEIAAALRVHASNLVRVLDELEEAGLVGRERDPADRRRQLVVLTAAGAETLHRAERAVSEVERELLAPLSSQQRRRLRELLGVLVRHACGREAASSCSQ